MVREMEVVLNIPDTDLGPHMRALAPKQRAFVYALVEVGGNPTQAAHAAGYGADSPTKEQRDSACRTRGYQLAHDPKVLKAIKEEASKRLSSGALIAATALLEIVNDTGHKDRMKAIDRLLGHAGLAVEQRSTLDINVNHQADGVQIEKIKRLAGNLGLDPRKLLGQAGIIVDAEFEVIEPKALPAPRSADGLEDLL